MKNIPLILLLIICNTFNSIAQENPVSDTTVWRIETKDHNVFKGLIIYEGRGLLELETEELGIVYLKKDHILYKSIYDPSHMIEGKYWPENTLYDRYILAPSGFLQAKKKGYYENRYVFINQWNISFTNDFSLGFGLMPLSLIGRGIDHVWLIPKVKIPTKNERFHFVTGVFFAASFYYPSNEISYFQLPFIVGTYGDKNLNFSIGTGFGRVDGDWMTSPSLSFGGNVRVGRRSYIFLENIIINAFGLNDYDENSSIFSFGVRTIMNRGILDYGLLSPRDINEDVGIRTIPYIGFILPFKKANKL